MQLAQFYTPGRCALSFELFPPKTEAMVETLMTAVGELMRFAPDYMTCTYGAGGSTRDRTLQVATAVHDKFGVPVASHLTCVGSTKEELRSYLRTAQSRGVSYIVALRGDPPKGETTFKATEGGLRYANELVQMIREEFQGFGIAVAGYPEVHQECSSFELDLQNLKRKVDAGADIVITQLFYDNADFYRFRDACERLGINVPIVPGILPVTNLAQIKRITSLCKARLPDTFVNQLAQKEDDEQWQFDVGVEYAQRQVQELIDADVPGVHFYVLNKSQATNKILAGLNGFESRRGAA